MRPLALTWYFRAFPAGAEAVLPVISSAALPPCAATANLTEEQFVFIFVRELQKTPRSLFSLFWQVQGQCLAIFSSSLLDPCREMTR